MSACAASQWVMRRGWGWGRQSMAGSVSVSGSDRGHAPCRRGVAVGRAGVLQLYPAPSHAGPPAPRHAVRPRQAHHLPRRAAHLLD